MFEVWVSATLNFSPLATEQFAGVESHWKFFPVRGVVTLHVRKRRIIYAASAQ